MFPADNETIGIYGLATLKTARGKGIGSALMSYSLQRARELGYKQAVLQASADGIRIYERLGFETVTRFFEFS
jgi:ribosomal protein S18 acetylase RimI-like enzyme